MTIRGPDWPQEAKQRARRRARATTSPAPRTFRASSSGSAKGSWRRRKRDESTQLRRRTRRGFAVDAEHHLPIAGSRDIDCARNKRAIVTCVIVEPTFAAADERQCLPIAKIAEPGYDNIVLSVAYNQRGGAVKDELILRRKNSIPQFCSASLHETRGAFSLRFGESDLSGVTFDRMTFDGSSRHFASLGSHCDGAADDPFVEARGEIVDFDPSAGSKLKSAALLQIVHQRNARDLGVDILDEGDWRRGVGHASTNQSGGRASGEPNSERQASDLGQERSSNPFENTRASFPGSQ